MTLLSKTRKVNRLLQRTGGQSVSFMEMSDVLSGIIEANIYVISRRGKILGYKLLEEGVKPIEQKERRLSKEENDKLLEIQETAHNLESKQTDKFAAQLRQLFLDSTEETRSPSLFPDRFTTIVPVIGGGERLGTLVLTRLHSQFVDDDLILAEYGSTVVGMEILREKAEEAGEEARNCAVAQMAIDSLSFSELEAVEHIFDELSGKENLLVASRVADQAGITRSVIVNALRKLESAGVVESRSLGMKGTYIKILNERLIPTLEKARG